MHSNLCVYLAHYYVLPHISVQFSRLTIHSTHQNLPLETDEEHYNGMLFSKPFDKYKTFQNTKEISKLPLPPIDKKTRSVGDNRNSCRVTETDWCILSMSWFSFLVLFTIVITDFTRTIVPVRLLHNLICENSLRAM